VVLADSDGRVHGYVRGPGSCPQVIGLDTAVALLDRLVGAALRVAEMPPSVPVTRAEVYHGISAAGTAFDWSTFKSQAVGEQNAWTQMFMGDAAPFKNLNLGFYRSSDLATYEASGQYELPRLGCFASSLRFGADWRTTGARPQSSLWAQAVLAYDFGKYVRITAVPTYLQRTNGDLGNFGGLPPFLPEPPHDLSCRPTGLPPELPQFTCSGLYENIFNVPVGASIAITHSITVHGEVYPRLSKVDAGGVGWAVTVEKSLLRHRFAFFAGNVKGTTVGQYAIAVPYAQPSKNVYIGFNLYRAWKLK